jgi:hypothetical protein
MIMAQLEAEVFEETVPFRADVCLPLTLTVSERAPGRFMFVDVDRP